MNEETDGCVKHARGPIIPVDEMEVPIEGGAPEQEVKKVLAKVGAEAPDFEANAFIADKGFKTIKLSDYKGQWIVLCFYPGDFTFVLPTELAAVAARYNDLKKLGVEVLSVSTDSH